MFDANFYFTLKALLGLCLMLSVTLGSEKKQQNECCYGGCGKKVYYVNSEINTQCHKKYTSESETLCGGCMREMGPSGLTAIENGREKRFENQEKMKPIKPCLCEVKTGDYQIFLKDTKLDDLKKHVDFDENLKYVMEKCSVSDVKYITKTQAKGEEDVYIVAYVPAQELTSDFMKIFEQQIKKDVELKENFRMTDLMEEMKGFRHNEDGRYVIRHGMFCGAYTKHQLVVENSSVENLKKFNEKLTQIVKKSLKKNKFKKIEYTQVQQDVFIVIYVTPPQFEHPNVSEKTIVKASTAIAGKSVNKKEWDVVLVAQKFTKNFKKEFLETVKNNSELKEYEFVFDMTKVQEPKFHQLGGTLAERRQKEHSRLKIEEGSRWMKTLNTVSKVFDFSTKPIIRIGFPVVEYALFAHKMNAELPTNQYSLSDFVQIFAAHELTKIFFADGINYFGEFLTPLIRGIMDIPTFFLISMIFSMGFSINTVYTFIGICSLFKYLLQTVRSLQ